MSGEQPWWQWHAKAPRCPAGVDWSKFKGRRLEITDGWMNSGFRPENFSGTVVANAAGTPEGHLTFDNGFIFGSQYWDMYDLDRGGWVRFAADGREWRADDEEPGWARACWRCTVTSRSRRGLPPGPGPDLGHRD